MFYIMRISEPGMHTIANADNGQVGEQLLRIMHGIAKPSTIMPMPAHEGKPTAMMVTNAGKGCVGECGQFVVFMNGHKVYSARHIQSGRNVVDEQINTEDRDYANRQMTSFMEKQVRTLSYGGGGFAPLYPAPTHTMPPLSTPPQVTPPVVDTVDLELKKAEDELKAAKIAKLRAEAAALAAPTPAPAVPPRAALGNNLPNMGTITQIVFALITIYGAIQSNQPAYAPAYQPRAPVPQVHQPDHTMHALQAIGTMVQSVIDGMKVIAVSQKEMVSTMKEMKAQPRHDDVSSETRRQDKPKKKREPVVYDDYDHDYDAGDSMVVHRFNDNIRKNQREEARQVFITLDPEEKYTEPVRKSAPPPEKPEPAPVVSKPMSWMDIFAYFCVGVVLTWLGLTAFVHCPFGE